LNRSYSAGMPRQHSHYDALFTAVYESLLPRQPLRFVLA
jgi:hypothetical protein